MMAVCSGPNLSLTGYSISPWLAQLHCALETRMVHHPDRKRSVRFSLLTKVRFVDLLVTFTEQHVAEVSYS